MPDRGTTTPKRSLEAAGALVVILALGLAFRLIIAYVLLPGSGFGVDRGTFQAWAGELAANGPLGFYDRGFFIDYTPGYLYVLWVVGIVGQALGGIGDLIKLPPILADVAIAWLVHSMVRELGGSRRAALLGAAIVLVNPVTWFDSAIWGQADSFGVVFLLLALRELWRGRPERASILAVVAAVIKPQLGILVPILVVLLVRRHLVLPLLARRRGGAPGPELEDRRPALLDRFGSGPVRLLTSGAAALATTWLLCLPFGIGIVGLVEQVVKTAGGYPYLTVNGYNPWALFSDGGNGLAAAGTWLRDSVGDKPGEVATLIWGIPAVLVGTGAPADRHRAPSASTVARRDDRWTTLLAVTVLAIAFFVVPTRVHERYLFPFFALGAILAAVSARWAVAYLVLAAASFGNLYAILLTPFYKNPGVTDWLGLGPAIRSPWGVGLIALAHLAVFIFALTELRTSRAVALAAATSAGRQAESVADLGSTAPRRAAVPAGASAPVAAQQVAALPVPGGGGRCRAGSRRGRPDGPAAGLVDGAVRGSVAGRRRRPAPAVRARRGPLLDRRPIAPAPLGGRRSLRPARPVVPRRRGRGRPGHPRVPAGRARADALRRGLPRPDGHRVPPGLALRETPRRSTSSPTPISPSTRWPSASSPSVTTG